MLTLLASAALMLAQRTTASPQKLDLPAVAMYWTAGYVANPPHPQILAAIWSDGRIVWRKLQKIYDRKWNYQKGDYLEACLDPRKVKSFMGSIDIDSLPKGGWEFESPDMPDFHEVLRLHGRALVMNVSDNFMNELKPRDKRDAEGIRVWKRVSSGIAKLIPKKGRPLSYKTAKGLLNWKRDWWTGIER